MATKATRAAKASEDTNATGGARARSRAPKSGLRLATGEGGGPATVPMTYFDLVRQFPLIPIRDDEHLQAASAVIDQLLMHELDEGQTAYLDVLTDLVEAYEDEHIEIRDASEADVLRELMSANRLTQAALQAATGMAQSTISAVLNGSRSLTKEQILTLARYFKVSPATFMADAE